MPHSCPVQPFKSTFKPVLLALACSLASSAVLAQETASEAEPATACSNFHAFANSDWLTANPAPSASAMRQLDARAQAQTWQLLDAAMQSPQGALETWLGDLWASGLNEAAIERAGAAPLAPLLKQIGEINRRSEITPAIATLHATGIPVLYGFAADHDLRTPDTVIGYFSQGGLGLPDPAYYTSDDAQALALLMRYRDYVGKILTLSGVPAEDLDASVQAVLDLEKRIAEESRALSLLRDDASRYAPVAVDTLAAQYPNLELDEFLAAQGVEATTVSLANPGLFSKLDGLVDTLEPEQWRAYLRFHLGNAMAPFLSQAWRDAHFALHGVMLRGQARPAPREQQVLSAVQQVTGPLLGRAWTARYVPATTLASAGTIAGQVRDTLATSLDSNTWMSPQARSQAKATLAGLTLEIGAPQPQVADAELPTLDRAGFGANMLAAAALRHRMQMQRIGSSGPTVWDVPAQQPALYYDPAGNRLIVTAAILQAPVLDTAQPVAAHYGAFGALVGHELTHAFDAAGRAPDDAAWTAADANAWNAKLDALGAQYLSYPMPDPPGVRFSWQRVAAESAADVAGVELAHTAFVAAQPAPDQAAQQGFYRAWAGLWPRQITAAQARVRAATAVHPPGYWRSNGPLLNQPAFAKAFSCDADAAMAAEEEARVSIWR